MIEDRCAWPRCKARSESIWIRGKKRFGYCDKHLEKMLQKDEKESKRRFFKYYALAKADVIEQHILRFGGNGGQFEVWPIRYALDIAVKVT